MRAVLRALRADPTARLSSVGTRTVAASIVVACAVAAILVAPLRNTVTLIVLVIAGCALLYAHRLNRIADLKVDLEERSPS